MSHFTSFMFDIAYSIKCFYKKLVFATNETFLKTFKHCDSATLTLSSISIIILLFFCILLQVICRQSTGTYIIGGAFVSQLDSINSFRIAILPFGYSFGKTQ